MSARASAPDGLTRIERDRRAQIVTAAVTLVAERGYAAASLARIAEAAGVVKGTVVYHFSTKDAVLEAAHRYVLTSLVEYVGARVDGASVRDAPGEYVRSMIEYLTTEPAHARTLVQVGLATANDTDAGSGAERWGPVAALVGAARDVDGTPIAPERSRTIAILVGGMIDAVIAEFLDDPGYDAVAAAEEIVAMMGAT